MTKLVLPRDEFLDDDPFYYGITMLISKKVEERLGIVRPNEITDFSRPPQIYFVFEGRTARPDDYRSDEWLKNNRPIRKSQVQPRHRKQAPDELVLVSAGHGYYKNLGPPAFWTFQRDPWGPPNEVQEDTITPDFASKLKGALQSRSLAIVRFARDHGNTNTHPPSGNMWWEMAAKYYVKRLLPERPDIWQNYPRTEPIPIDVEQKDDVRSRPVYANYLGALGLISLHTNSPPVTPGQPVDTRVGTH